MSKSSTFLSLTSLSKHWQLNRVYWMIFVCLLSNIRIALVRQQSWISKCTLLKSECMYVQLCQQHHFGFSKPDKSTVRHKHSWFALCNSEVLMLGEKWGWSRRNLPGTNFVPSLTLSRPNRQKMEKQQGRNSTSWFLEKKITCAALKCKCSLVFFVFCDGEMNVYELLVTQNKILKHVTLGSGHLWLFADIL